MTTTRLTVYLLKDVAEPGDALDPENSATLVALAGAADIQGAFYYSTRPPAAPHWVTFVAPLLTTRPTSLRTSSASGLLILKTSDRFFAFTFGYGRALLDLSKIEHQFGLRVALNRINPSQIRSIDTKTFEDMVVTRNTQTSKSSELPTFGVDVSRDILRAVTGEPRDRLFAKRLSGADALVVNLEIAAIGLPKLCTELLEAFQEDSYKRDFSWIDQLSLVDDPSLNEELNMGLERQLQSRDTSSTHMAMPETLEWADIDAFKITGTKALEYEDIDLDAYLDRLGEEARDLTTSQLKRRRVSVRFSRATDFDPRWTIYQCLVSEQRVDGLLHVLIEGRWFAVSDSLVDEVDGYVSTLSATSSALINSLPAEQEADYNVRLVDSSPSSRLLMDARIQRPGGATSGIELCDILTSEGEFIHVKRKSRSSTLSHLFAQGLVSATTFLGDGEFRDGMREKITAITNDPARSEWLDLVPPGRAVVDRTRYSVSFVVIANSSRKGHDWLPFFSKLNLMQCGKQLRNLGFGVFITRVPISP